MMDMEAMTRARRRQARFILVACAAAWTLATAGARAQDTDESAAAPVAEREVPWDTMCSQASRQAEPDCEMSQMVIVPQSRQVLLRVEVEVPGDGSGPRMVLQLPHGIYLPAGLVLAIDGEEWQRTELQTCDGQGCYAGFGMDDDALRRLQRGEKLTVVFQSLAREEMSVPVDLDGFTGAYTRIR